MIKQTQKPDFQEAIQKLEEYSQNLKANNQIGNSKLMLAFVEMIRAMSWSSNQQDTNNNQIDNLIEEIQKLKDVASENSDSSKRFATWSLTIAIVAIISSLIIGGVQIYLAKVQTYPIWEQQLQSERNLYENCKEPGNWDISDGGATPGSTCKQAYIQLKGKFGIYPAAENSLK